MPLYEYECTNCGHAFSHVTKVDERDKIKCPKCKTLAMRKFSSNQSFIFKGKGQYKSGMQ